MNVYADDACETKSGYELYTCRSEKICEIPEYTNDSPVYKSEEYLEASEYLNALDTKENAPYEVLKTVKKQYRKNIGNTYSCGMIQVQRNSLNIVKELVKRENSGSLDDIIKQRILSRETKLEAAYDVLKCSKWGEAIQNKQNMLSETTQELCFYVTYLEYLKDYYSSIPNLIWITEDLESNPWDTKEEKDRKEGLKWVVQNYSTSEISLLISDVETTINREINHTYKISPIAFQAYTEYENNYPLHFLLEIIREDFVLLRKRVHESLMPIAQVGYKIINAMIK